MFSKIQPLLNKYNLFIILFHVCTFSPVASQSGTSIDALRNKLLLQKEDTVKVNTYLQLSQELIHTGNLPEASNQQINALDLAENLNYLLGEARSYNTAGIILMWNDHFEQARLDFNHALQLSKQTGSQSEVAYATLNLGTLDFIVAKPDEAIEQINYASGIFHQLNDKTGIIQCNNVLSDVFLMKGKYSEAAELSILTIGLETEINDKSALAQTYSILGRAHSQMGNSDMGLNYYHESLQLAEELDLKMILARCYYWIGMNYYNRGDFPNSQENLENALSIYRELGMRRGIGLVYGSLGNVEYDKGVYSSAIQYHLDALKINQEINLSTGIARAYSNLANIYFVQGNFQKALEYQSASLVMHEKMDFKMNMATNLYNLSLIYMELNQPEKALESQIASSNIYKEIGAKNDLPWSLKHLGSIYAHLSNYEKAIETLELAIKMSEEVGDSMNLTYTLIDLAAAQINTCKYDEAKSNLELSLSISIRLGLKHPIRECYHNLMKLDSLEGNYAQALAHYHNYTLYKDSLTTEANHQLTLELQAKYDTEKKEKEILKLHDEKAISQLQLKSEHDNFLLTKAEKEKLHTENLYNLQKVELLDKEKKLQQLEIEKNQAHHLTQQTEIEKNKNQLVLLNKEREVQGFEIRKQRLLKNYFLVGVILFAVLSFFIYRYYITHQKLKLQVLRNKIASDLHDEVGSTLSSIYIFSEVAQQQSKEVIPLLTTIGENSRKMLDAMADIVWTINPENDQFEKILLKMRGFAYELLGAKKIEFKFTADEHIATIRLPMDVRKNLYLIFKEAANNMAKYSGADKASFSISEKKGLLTMMIRDNGKGFALDHPTEGNGIKNMKKRASEIGANLLIDSMPGSGTTIQLSVAI